MRYSDHIKLMKTEPTPGSASKIDPRDMEASLGTDS